MEGGSRSCPSGSGKSRGSALGDAMRSCGHLQQGEARGHGTGAWFVGSRSG